MCVKDFAERYSRYITIGFPYNDEDGIDKDLSQLLEPLLGKDSPLQSDEDQLILMTHVGPSNSCKRGREGGEKQIRSNFIL